MLSFCSGDGLVAERSVALACLPPGFPFEECISRLLNKSLLVYRSYRSEYIVWEGSDYDVVGRVDQELDRVSLDVAIEMNRRIARPILAHRHYIETGNRRVAHIVWLNAEDSIPKPSPNPRVLVWLGTIPTLPSRSTVHDVVGQASIETLKPHLRAIVAIQRLVLADQELRDDRVALRELQERLDYHESSISTHVDQILSATDGVWTVGEKGFSRLQEAITVAMYRRYPRAFVLHMDMVNRDRVSGAVSSALRRLIEALYRSSHVEHLGIERFPAERIIYESFIRSNNLHQQASNGDWRLVARDGKIPKGLQYVIEAIKQELAYVQGGTAKTVESLVEFMHAPPFGQKRYPTLVLCVLLLLIDRDKYELYEDSKYLAHWGPQTLNRMVKAPKRFAITSTPEASINEGFLREYCMALSGQHAESSPSPVSIARATLSRYAQLTPIARTTVAVSEEAQALRQAIRVAKSPTDLLFRSIPRAFGHRSLPTSGTPADEFLARIRQARICLETAPDTIIQKLGDIMTQAMRCGSLAEARQLCVKYASSALMDSRMYHGLERFTGAVCSSPNDNDRAWLLRVIEDGLGVTVPLSSWTDAHVAQAEFVLRQTLIAVQQAARLLTGQTSSRDTTPFVVLLPGRNMDEHLQLEEEVQQLINKVPRENRMSFIINLVKQLRKLK